MTVIQYKKKKEGKGKKGDEKETERGRERRPLHFTFMSTTLQRGLYSLAAVLSFLSFGVTLFMLHACTCMIV